MTDEDYRYTAADVDALREQVNICAALSDAQDRWPEISQVAFRAESPQHLVELVADLLGVTDEAASAVSEMQVMRASVAERSKLRGQLDDLRAELARALAQRGE